MNKAARRFAWPLRGNVFVVLDGDTIRCELDKGDDWWCAVSVRLEGVDTPEKTNTSSGGLVGKKAGLLVKEVVKNWCFARLGEGAWLYASSTEKPKFSGRIIGLFWAEHPSGKVEVLNDYLLSTGLCKVYAGGPRGWTEEEYLGITARAYEILGGDPIGDVS